MVKGPTTGRHCWTVVFERSRSNAQNRGYGRLRSILEDCLKGWTIKDFNGPEEIENCVQENGVEGTLLIVGHRTDLEAIDFGPLARIPAVNILELHFTTAESAGSNLAAGAVFKEKQVPYCSIPELAISLSKARPDDFLSQDKLTKLTEAYRAEVYNSILDPLLPMAVLAEGFLVLGPQNAAEWFRPGIEAALESSWMAGDSVARVFWRDLEIGKTAIENLREMLEDPAKGTPGFATAMQSARALWQDTKEEKSDHGKQAALLYRHAYEAVKAIWDALTSNAGAPLGGSGMRELVEAASVGFQVLTAGHL